MPDPSRLALFVGAALLLLVVPGPSVLYIVTQSVSHGRRAGIVSVAGITTGTLVHIAAATVGLSALLASSALAFDVVKYLGAAYLIVGRHPPPGAAGSAGPAARARDTRDLGRLYRQGIVVNTLNPKTALFFLAFLPQFVDPGRGTPWLQILAARPALRRARASSATASGRSWPGRSASACAAAAASRRCSATSPARCSSASARSQR